MNFVGTSAPPVWTLEMVRMSDRFAVSTLDTAIFVRNATKPSSTWSLTRWTRQPAEAGCRACHQRIRLQCSPLAAPAPGGISTVDLHASTWSASPWKYEGGTLHDAEAIGLGAAVGYLGSLGMTEVREHQLALKSLADRAGA